MPLFNAFVDAIVNVGFSSEKGLKLSAESDKNASFFTLFLQPSLLAIVTADQAMYPQSDGSIFVDPHYPPIDRTNSYSNTNRSRISTISTSSTTPNRNIRSQKQYTIPAALNNLPLFCFPEDVRATYEREDERIHHVVFTQEEGKRTYALILTFQQPFILKNTKPDDDGTYQIEDIKSSNVRVRSASKSRIPVPTRTIKTDESSPTSSSTSRGRPKMPKAYKTSGGPKLTHQSRSNSSDDLSKQPRYEQHTISSRIKDKGHDGNPIQTGMKRRNSITSAPRGFIGEPNHPVSNASRSESVDREHKSASFDPVKPFYLPHCIVLLSENPYWSTMYETLSLIYDEIIRLQIEPSSAEYKQLIQRYSFFACNTPTPPLPIECFLLSFDLTYGQSVLHLDPPRDINHAAIDLDLANLLLTISIGKLLDVLAVILTQQPIIFFSLNYSKLVTTVECLLYLIYPFQWTHVYVPLVPDGLRDYYLEGPPGSYIMGTHSRNQKPVEDRDSSFTCNLDDDKNIHVPKGFRFHQIPANKHYRFVSQITQLTDQIKTARALKVAHSPARLQMTQQREKEHQERLETNKQIIKIFLDFIVDLFGDALDPIYWTNNAASPKNTLEKTFSTADKVSNSTTKKKFNKKQYLDSKVEGIELEFYEAVVESSSFQLLMEEETESKVPTTFKKIHQIHCSVRGDLKHINSITSKTHDHDEDAFTSSFYDSLSSQIFLPLPSWSLTSTKHYLDSCIELFANELTIAQKKQSSILITVYSYLRGCAYLARGEYLAGLNDLYSITDPNLFPLDYIENTVVPIISNEGILDSFLQASFYENASSWMKVRSPLTMHYTPATITGNSSTELINITLTPEPTQNSEWIQIQSDLTFEEFNQHVLGLGIVQDNETSKTLFNVLLRWTEDTSVKTSEKKKPPTALPVRSLSAIRPPSRRMSLSEDTLRTTLHRIARSNENATELSASKAATQTSVTLPSELMELFQEIWQQTNVEKVRMSRCLPEDRQHSEMILKISTSGISSRSDGPGELILTQQRLYFLPEALYHARLYTELTNIEAVEKYCSQTLFSSSKPGIKIYTLSLTPAHVSSLPRDKDLKSKLKSTTVKKESKSSIRLLFNNTREQNLWYTIITEMWSGVKIAFEQHDAHILNRATSHITIMDILSNIYFDAKLKTGGRISSTDHLPKHKQAHNEMCFEMALDDFATAVRLKKDPKPVPGGALVRRISPSINENERHPVRCLVFAEIVDIKLLTLWCAYGSKLKVFNTKTWICEPVDKVFPSAITCMCLDRQFTLWVGCIRGELFVVDTVTHDWGSLSASISDSGGCQTIVYDSIYDHILTASQKGSVIVWNASTRDRLFDINLYSMYESFSHQQSKQVKPSNENVSSWFDKLQELQVYNDLLFACYHCDYIHVLRKTNPDTYQFEHVISVKYRDESALIDSFTIFRDQLWVAAASVLSIISVDSTVENNPYSLLSKRAFDDDNLVTMIGHSDCIWAGSLSGKIYIFRMDNYETRSTLTGHHDTITCLCSMLDTYILSGSAQNDTSIIIWDSAQISSTTTTGFSGYLQLKATHTQ